MYEFCSSFPSVLLSQHPSYGRQTFPALSNAVRFLCLALLDISVIQDPDASLVQEAMPGPPTQPIKDSRRECKAEVRKQWKKNLAVTSKFTPNPL